MSGEVEVSEAEYKAEFPDKPLAGGMIGSATEWKKPIFSNSAAVVPKRIKDFEKLCEQHGVPTDFTSGAGSPKFTSRAHRQKVLKIIKMHDNDGGYGD